MIAAMFALCMLKKSTRSLNLRNSYTSICKKSLHFYTARVTARKSPKCVCVPAPRSEWIN